MESILICNCKCHSVTFVFINIIKSDNVSGTKNLKKKNISNYLIYSFLNDYFLWLSAVTFAPDTIPDFLGPISKFGLYMSQFHNFNVVLCVATVVLHTVEAAYAGKVCYDRDFTSGATVKWVISTFLFGFSSLLLRLLPYKPDQQNFEEKRKK
ncbi:hypothetical protein Btru_057185 [Bulinus truncatus]|nr:hypothetical protein Btru_057185 [Bulinus truncatus]